MLKICMVKIGGRGFKLFALPRSFCVKWWVWFKSFTLPRPFYGKWWAWFKSFTHATPFLWCQSMQQEKYFKWSLLLLFLSYLFLHDYRLLLLSVLDKKYAKIFHEELLLWRRSANLTMGGRSIQRDGSLICMCTWFAYTCTLWYPFFQNI